MSFKRGDHLKSRRYGIVYAHHGIYLGEGKVLHYAGLVEGFMKGRVCIGTLEEFSDNHIEGIVVVKHKQPKFDVETRIKRGMARVGEDKYSVIFNNCEHFVNYCIEGKAQSVQVQRGKHVIQFAVNRLFGYQAGRILSFLMKNVT